MERVMEQRSTTTAYKVKMLVLTALFIALGYVATTVLMVPCPTGGYKNLGDNVELLGA